MKTLLLSAAALLCLAVATQAQTIPSYVPTNGLVGWWPFNGNANDESGNGNNLIINSATLTVNRDGLSNSAYYFDGLNSYMFSTNSVPFIINNEITFSVWIRPQDIRNSSIIDRLPFSSNTERGYRLALRNNGEIWAQYGSGGIGVTASASNFIYSINNWVNIAVVYKINNSMEIFVNGTSLGIQSIAGAENSLEPFEVGRWSQAGGISEYFYGDIDDIGFWNRALTQQEITNLYNASTSIPIISCPGAQMPLNLTNGLVGWWPFCGDADDESGNGSNGTVNGATLTSDRFGNANSAYEFDGINDYINVLPNTLFSADTVTVSAWLKAYSSNGIQFIVNGNQNNSTWSLLYNNIGFGDLLNQGCTGTSSNNFGNPPSLNQWIYVTYIFTPSTVKLYINGLLISTQTGPPFNSSCGINGLYFGLDIYGQLEYFNGILDDIGIWNRALDSSEVAQLYNTGLCTQTIAGSCDTLIFNANITGFNPVTYANQVRVYPNPASDNLVIDCGSNYAGLGGYSIRITNLLGQTVYNNPVTAQVTNIQLTPPTWVNGTYVAQFINPQGTVLDTKRIIVQ